jgi:hypothetical protein
MTNFIILEDGTIKNNLLFRRNAVSETHGGLLYHPALPRRSLDEDGFSVICTLYAW